MFFFWASAKTESFSCSVFAADSLMALALNDSCQSECIFCSHTFASASSWEKSELIRSRRNSAGFMRRETEGRRGTK